MKKTLLIDFKRELGKSKGRFVAIFMLMFISSFALMGLKQTGPDIRQTADDYLFNYNLADLTITSTLGFADDEINTLSNLTDIKDIEYDYFFDNKIANTNDSIRVFSESDNISEYELVSGKLPESKGEIALTNQLADQYQIGDEITFSQSDDSLLTSDTFQVVGFVNSMEIIAKVGMGQSTAGSGNLTGYAVVTDDNFDSDVYTIARITYNDLYLIDPFTDEYETKLIDHKQELDDTIATLPQTRLDTITTDANKSIAEGYAEIDDALQQLEDAKAELDSGKLELDDGKKVLDDSYQLIYSGQKKITQGFQTIAEKQKLLDTNRAKLTKGMKTYKTNKQELDSQQEKLDAGQNELTANKDDLVTKQQSLDAGKTTYESKIDDLNGQIAAIEDQLTNPDLTPTEITNLEEQKAILEAGLSAVDSEYQSFLTDIYQPGTAQITAGLTQIASKQQEIDNAQDKLDAGYKQLSAAYSQLKNGLAQVESGQKKLNTSKQTLDTQQAKLTKNKQLLDESYQTYLDGLETYNQGLATYNSEEATAMSEIADARQELEDAAAEVADLSAPVYRVSTRTDALGSEGYQMYSSLATSIDKIANIFPIVLYIVAALVTFTTMSRFVEEERINSGTLLSLGYSQTTVTKKFVYYGLIASLLGSTLGCIAGNFVLPWVIYSAFSTNFTFPGMSFTFDFIVTIISILISILVAIIPAILVVKTEFNASPASLLLPKPPVSGSKILLERVTPIWSRLKFAHKVTARNIFRYKKRMLMTIFGVCGSVALLFTGLGMQSSIAGINELQFQQLMKYDMIVSVDDEANKSDESNLLKIINGDEFKSYLPIYADQTHLETSSGERQDITMLVPDDYAQFEDYFVLRDRVSQQRLELTDDGVIINEKLAQILDLNIGDTIEFIDSEDISHRVTISGITELYMGHFIIMNKEYYQQIYGEEPVDNSLMLKLTDNSEENINDIATQLMDLPAVLTVTQNSILIDQVNIIVKSLNSVMFALVIIAVALAIVILYNLTNINVSERMRELSTTKVLGYFDKEVTMYIYRETIILTFIGILAGFVMGRIFQLFMIKTVAPSFLMFDPTLPIHVFLVPALTTTIVTIVLGIVINNRLKNVDMLDALKSVD